MSAKLHRKQRPLWISTNNELLPPESTSASDSSFESDNFLKVLWDAREWRYFVHFIIKYIISHCYIVTLLHHIIIISSQISLYHVVYFNMIWFVCVIVSVQPKSDWATHLRAFNLESRGGKHAVFHDKTMQNNAWSTTRRGDTWRKKWPLSKACRQAKVQPREQQPEIQRSVRYPRYPRRLIFWWLISIPQYSCLVFGGLLWCSAMSGHLYQNFWAWHLHLLNLPVAGTHGSNDVEHVYIASCRILQPCHNTQVKPPRISVDLSSFILSGWLSIASGWRQELELSTRMRHSG